MSKKPSAREQMEGIAEFVRQASLANAEDDPVFLESEAFRRGLREGSLRTMEFFFRGLRVLAQYDGNRNMALDCFILAHGKGDFIGMQSAVEVAVRHLGDATKKYTATKCIKLFQDCLEIPAMPGQRGDAGRKAMSCSRNAQLNKAKPCQAEPGPN